MASEALQLGAIPQLDNATMLLALTGWMDGGAVSTGTLRNIMDGRTVTEIARIAPDPFYIYNFPGTMELTALFRPEVTVKRGLIRELDMPVNVFFSDEANKLVFFIGREPNLRWEEFADCIFEVAERSGIARILFMGSFGGSVPHTREPRMFGSVSEKRLRSLLRTHKIRPSDYNGPASFSTLLLAKAASHKVEMLSLVAEIPGYLEGPNLLSIEAVTRRLAKILNVPINLSAMRESSNAWEQQVTEAVQQDAKLAATIKQLEDAYDTELVEEQEEEA